MLLLFALPLSFISVMSPEEKTANQWTKFHEKTLTMQQLDRTNGTPAPASSMLLSIYNLDKYRISVHVALHPRLEPSIPHMGIPSILMNRVYTTPTSKLIAPTTCIQFLLPTY
jgi:hypothetical protein